MLETPTSTIPNTQNAVRRVGVVGFGHMGHAFAVKLLEGGYQALAHDHDAKRATALSGAREPPRSWRSLSPVALEMPHQRRSILAIAPALNRDEESL